MIKRLEKMLVRLKARAMTAGGDYRFARYSFETGTQKHRDFISECYKGRQVVRGDDKVDAKEYRSAVRDVNALSRGIELARVYEKLR